MSLKLTGFKLLFVEAKRPLKAPWPLLSKNDSGAFPEQFPA